MGLIEKTVKSVMKRKKAFTSAVIAAGGSSERMGGINKLLYELVGTPVIVRTMLAFQNSCDIDEIIVVAREDDCDCIRRLAAEHSVTKVSSVVAGGASRAESVMNGIGAVSQKADVIAIHDGARPFVTGTIIHDAVLTARKFSACAPGVPVTATIKRVSNSVVVETVDRSDLYEMQTPQVFAADVIRVAAAASLSHGSEITDDCMSVEAIGCPVRIIPGSYDNFKITTASDIARAEAFISQEGAECE